MKKFYESSFADETRRFSAAWRFRSAFIKARQDDIYIVLWNTWKMINLWTICFKYTCNDQTQR